MDNHCERNGVSSEGKGCSGKVSYVVRTLQRFAREGTVLPGGEAGECGGLRIRAKAAAADIRQYLEFFKSGFRYGRSRFLLQAATGLEYSVRWAKPCRASSRRWRPRNQYLWQVENSQEFEIEPEMPAWPTIEGPHGNKIFPSRSGDESEDDGKHGTTLEHGTTL